MKTKTSSSRIAIRLIIVQPDQTEKRMKSQITEKMNDRSNIATDSTDI